MNSVLTSQAVCYHCGEVCPNDTICSGDKRFCCFGCKTVFEILNENNLCAYYDLNTHPGIKISDSSTSEKYEFLNDNLLGKHWVVFNDAHNQHLLFSLPQIHCSSCLWLLENLPRIEKGVLDARVDFIKKEVYLITDKKRIKASEVAGLLKRIGYEPYFNAQENSPTHHTENDKQRLYRIGVAGFCFANLMMLHLAEYLSGNHAIEPIILNFLKILAVGLSLPVLLFAASEFFVNAWKSLKERTINIDLPIAVALLVTYIRSVYELISGGGLGYFDSFSGIVFFMLLARWVQQRSYKSIRFDRDFRSFFPVAITTIVDGEALQKAPELVRENDVIRIQHKEIIPVDAIVLKGSAIIDYSFVTGESSPEKTNIGEIVYAGGRQENGALELLCIKNLNQSKLTSLWNNPIFTKQKSAQSKYDVFAKYFTWVVISLAIIAVAIHLFNGNNARAINAFTTVLIVACPCALLLAHNFTYGNLLRIFGMQKFYIKSAAVFEQLNQITHIVFDKTGTLTQSGKTEVRYVGTPISEETKNILYNLLLQSSHPLSKIIASSLGKRIEFSIKDFKEIAGAGIECWYENQHIKIGSAAFINCDENNVTSTQVYISIDTLVIGYFNVVYNYRNGLQYLLDELQSNYKLTVLSGDNDVEKNKLKVIFGENATLLFKQNPTEKMNYINQLQQTGEKVMMIGDGLNDAGALKKSDVGIAVADNTNNFTPACDAIINGNDLVQLNDYLQLSKKAETIINFTFGVSVLYNIIGLTYALQGILSPMIAAILMPLSSLTIIGLTYGLTNFYARKTLINSK